MSKHKNLVHQIESELMSQRRYGQSKYKARRDEKTRNPEGIFSKKTFNTYLGLCRAFGQWAADVHRCRELDEARQYVPEYLQIKIDEGKSAWTVKTIAASLAKLFHVSLGDFGVTTPPRERKDIKRSRFEPSETFEKKYPDIVDFVCGSGLRRKELGMLHGEDVYKDSGKVYIYVKNGKGGKERTVTALEEYAEKIYSIAGKVKPEELIFPHIPCRAPMHHYRGCFAKAMYNRLARPVKEIPRKERYVMRKDRAGEVLDKKAMLQVSRQLGHNRIDVIAGNYLYREKRGSAT